jgi:hypothetical protein
MRTAREIDGLIEGLKPWAPALYDILATSDEEAELIRSRLHGRHGVKHIGIAMGTPDDLKPLGDRLGVSWNDVPVNPKEGVAKPVKTTKAKWDEEGY